MEPQTLTTVAEPLVNRWLDACQAGYIYLKPTGASFYRADDGGTNDGVLVRVESGTFDLPKSSVTLLTELEAIAQGDLKAKLHELREEFERFPEGTYLWMWWSEPYADADSRFMPVFDEQVHEDEFRRLRALSIQAGRMLAEIPAPISTAQSAPKQAPAESLQMPPVGGGAPQEINTHSDAKPATAESPTDGSPKVPKTPRQHGFRADMDRHQHIAAIVEQHVPTWRGNNQWRHRPLKDICTDLDKAEIEVPDSWRKGNPQALDRTPAETWAAALELAGPKLVADQIRTSLSAVIGKPPSVSLRK